MGKMSVSQAIREGMREEMLRDENVIMVGEDLGVMGSPFAVTKGFIEEFGKNRVIETPIAESGFTGMAVGAAMRGLRPVVELMYNDFISVALDPVMNQAAKLRYMTGGQVSIPMVIRAPMGAGRRNAGQHSQCLEALFTHIPGLKVVCPSTAADAKALIKAAIRDDDPVVFLEHKLLYAIKDEVPEGEHVLPIGKAEVRRTGKDVTILTWSRQVFFALDAAKELEEQGIDAEVIDLRSLVPLDWEAVKASVEKTHNVVVVEEGVKRGGIGAEIAAEITEKLFNELNTPVCRVAGLNVCSPFSPPLEDAVFPHAKDIVSAIRNLLDQSGCICSGGRNAQEDTVSEKAETVPITETAAPAVSCSRSVDVTALTELKDLLSGSGQKISCTDILVKLAANVLMEFPYINSTEDKGNAVFHDYVNMGIAAATDNGLVVPVIKNVHIKSLVTISNEIKDLTAKAEQGTLTSDETSGGTFTIINMEMFGMDSFSPAINRPESAALGVSAIVKAPVEVGGEIVLRPKMTLSLAADHRVIDSAMAARFLQKICSIIENPSQMLL